MNIIKIKYYCVNCKGEGICEHNKNKTRCTDCKGSHICEHNKNKDRSVKICKGSQICEHNKRKEYCKKCGGKSLCNSEWCETIASNKKYKGYLLHIVLFIYFQMKK